MCSDENAQRGWLATRKCFFFASEGGNGLFTFFSSWKFPNSQSPEAHRERIRQRFSYHRAEARKTLFTRSRSAFPRCQAVYQCENMLRGFTFYYEMSLLEWKVWMTRCFGLDKKCSWTASERERVARWFIHRSGDMWTFTGGTAAPLCHDCIRLELTLTLSWRQSPCCTGTGAQKLSTPSCPNFFAVHVSSQVVDGLIKISLMSTVGRRPSAFFSLFLNPRIYANYERENRLSLWKSSSCVFWTEEIFNFAYNFEFDILVLEPRLFGLASALNRICQVFWSDLPN